MKKNYTALTTIAAFLFILLSSMGALGQNIWFNEIHYDNTGTDADETIEIVLENPGSYTLSDFQIDLYNGNGGAVYNTKTLDQYTAGSTSGNFTFYTFNYTANGESIQNGGSDPDGMCLSYQGTVISGQFLSYEGTFTAADGPAAGLLSTDIGEEETSGTPAGHSLQLSGTGTAYSDFTWLPPDVNTFGNPNNGQTIGGGGVSNPSGFAADAVSSSQIDLSWSLNANSDDVVLAWNSTNTFGTPTGSYVVGNTITGGGTVLYVGSGTTYNHTSLNPDTEYFYKIWSVDGTTTYSSGVEADATTFAFEPSNYPTAFAAVENGIQIELDWTDATGSQLPVAYIVKASDQDNITAPVDGVPEDDDTDLSDGAGALNIAFGEEMCIFYKLAGQTQYFFEIYPYTNSGSNIDYKNDGTAPAANATTSTIINVNDFESGDFGDWTTFSVASDKDWGTLDFGGALETDWFAQMNGFQENEPSNDWLLSPALDIDSYGNAQMIFFTQWRYGSTLDELTLKYSSDYTGGDPTLASWTELPFSKPSDDQVWESSGVVDLSVVSGSAVTFAFQYLSSGNPTRWNVDEIAITGNAVVPVINVTSPSTGDSWEQGSTHDITWTAANTLPNVMIELTTDASGGSPTWTTLVSSIPASSGSWTWNISPTQPTSNDCQIRITDMASDATGLSDIFSIVEPIYIPDIVINEIMYNPPEAGTDSLEYLELYNNDSQTIDLEGFYFSNGVDFTFPSHSFAPGDYVMVASDSLAFNSFFGEVAYEFSGGLSNGGELVLLRHPLGATVDSVEYDDNAPWPTEPDGDGPSLVICDPNVDNSLGENWTYSQIYQGMNTEGDSVFGSPGMLNCMTAPDPDFEADNTSITTGGSVNFTDLSTGNPTTWEWTFQGGDPTYYSGQNPPPITYSTPGTYSVSLFVSNAAGSDTETKDDYITVGDFPTADFEASEDTILVGTAIDFTDLSLGDPTSWEWTFEGGTPETSTDQNPAGIQYDTPGFYNVTLFVVNAVGDDILVKEEYIKVGYVPVADFEASKDTVDEGDTVDFTDLSQYDPDTWSWTFEGGIPETSTDQNPAGIVYETEGTYDVTLRVENMFGFTEEIKIDYIVVVDPLGVEELLKNSLRIYPNPNNGNFNIENNFEGPVQVRIFDMLGSMVYSGESSGSITNIGFEDLDKGIYFVKVTPENGNKTATGKIIVF